MAQGVFKSDPERHLIISDLQIPFEADKALSFCKYIKKHYRISDDNILNCGDETDQYFGGLWKKDPNAHHSAVLEIRETKEKLRKWYRAFPKMKLAISNHGTRWMRKATEAEIPSQMLRNYEDVIEAPDTWIWKKRWVIQCQYPFMLEHGDDWGGQFPHKQAALHNACSTAMGHHHSIAGVEHLKTNGVRVWGMAVGSLIDFDQYAFNYARKAKFKPVSTVGVVVNSGRDPQIIRMD